MGANYPHCFGVGAHGRLKPAGADALTVKAVIGCTYDQIWLLSTPNLLALVFMGQSTPAGAGDPGEKSNWGGAVRAG
jgi:hypothetical protein